MIDKVIADLLNEEKNPPPIKTPKTTTSWVKKDAMKRAPSLLPKRTSTVLTLSGVNRAFGLKRWSIGIVDKAAAKDAACEP